MYNLKKYLLVFLLIGTSLFMNPFLNTVDVFEFPKLLALILPVALLTIINIIQYQKIKFPIEFIFLGLFLLSNIISFILSVDQNASLMGENMRFQGFLTQIHYILLAFNVFIFFRQYPEEKNLFQWLIILLIIACLIALSPYILPILIFDPILFQDRIFGTFGNPNYLASFIIATLPFFLLLKGRHIYFLPIILLALFLTGSRSAWIAAIFAFLILGILQGIKFRKFKVLGITILAGLLLVSAVALQTNFHASESLNRLSAKEENLKSYDTRKHLWVAGLKLSLERPFFGSGQETINGRIEPYLPEHLQANEVFFIDRTHSEFIDIAVTLGYFGLLTYLGFFLIILFKSIKKFPSNPYFFATFTVILYFLAAYLSASFSTIIGSSLPLAKNRPRG